MTANGHRHPRLDPHDHTAHRLAISEALATCAFAAMYVTAEPQYWESFISWARALDEVDSLAAEFDRNNLVSMAMLAFMLSQEAAP